MITIGRRGPMPKLERTRNDRAPVVMLNAERQVAPPAPKGLLLVNRRRWDTYFASDVARALSEVDLPAVERLWAYYDTWTRAMAAGQVREAVAVERSVLNLERELGLTPSARARLGIQVGQAKRLSLADVRKSLER